MFDMKDVMPEIYKSFPEIEESALDTICKDGLKGMLYYMRKKDDVRIVTIADAPLIFYKPESPKRAWERLQSHRFDDRDKALAKERLENGEKNE